jgi:hypothetical protein
VLVADYIATVVMVVQVVVHETLEGLEFLVKETMVVHQVVT